MRFLSITYQLHFSPILPNAVARVFSYHLMRVDDTLMGFGDTLMRVDDTLMGFDDTLMRFTVRNSNGQAVANATVQLDGTTKKAVTDLLGLYRIDRVRPDDYLVNVSANGYTPQQVVHHISRGKMDELDFHLVI